MARLKLVLVASVIRGEYLKINSEMQEALAEAIATRRVQGHLDGRAIGQAEGLISLPDPRINLWISPSRMSRPALTVKTRRNCPVE